MSNEARDIMKALQYRKLYGEMRDLRQQAGTIVSFPIVADYTALEMRTLIHLEREARLGLGTPELSIYPHR